MVYLQHGGGDYRKQTDATVTTCTLCSGIQCDARPRQKVLAPCQRARQSEEPDELEDETHDEEPRIAGEVRVGYEQTPQHDQHHCVEHIPNVAKPCNTQ